MNSQPRTLEQEAMKAAGQTREEWLESRKRYLEREYAELTDRRKSIRAQIEEVNNELANL